MKTKKRRSASKPLTVSIHGQGIDIDAKITDTSGLNALVAGIADQLTGRTSAVNASPPNTSPSPTQAANAAEPDHDFDVVQRVIKHGDIDVLRAIFNLANQELEARSAAS